MTATLLLVAAVIASAGPRDRPQFFRLGGDPGPGILVNLSAARPFDSPDPARPTVVFVHGFNPTPRAVHFTMGERLAESFARRGGPQPNVLAWNWNAATFVGLSLRENIESNVGQGRRLASAIRAHGLSPSRTHLIGHSSGSIVVASAARALRTDLGQPVAQLTFLDPAFHYHEVVFGRLAAGTASPRVENYWAPGPGAFGREVLFAGVRNYRVDAAASHLGAVYFPRSAHWNVVRWYLATVEDRACPSGYNAGVTGRAGW